MSGMYICKSFSELIRVILYKEWRHVCSRWKFTEKRTRLKVCFCPRRNSRRSGRAERRNWNCSIYRRLSEYRNARLVFYKVCCTHIYIHILRNNCEMIFNVLVYHEHKYVRNFSHWFFITSQQINFQKHINILYKLYI